MFAALFAKFETYIIAVALAAAVGAGLYFKGRHDEATIIHTQELAAAAKALSDAAIAARERQIGDEKAREAAERFIDTVNGNLLDVTKRFANVPQVIVNDKGCPDFAPSFRLRWNAVDSATDQTGPAANGPTSSVPANRVPDRP